MVTTPGSRIEKSTSQPRWRWWLSLWPRLSARSKRGVVVACLGAAMVAQSVGLMDSAIRQQSPYHNPAVQNALHALGLADPIGDQFQVNSYTTNYQVEAAVAMDSNGDFIVVWESSGSPGSDSWGTSIQGRRYNSAGTAQGNQFQVNNYTTNNQRVPAVSMDSDGKFVVVWQSVGSSGSDPYTWSVQGRRYNSAGTAQGNQFQVNTYTTNSQVLPAVAMDSNGDFVVVWQNWFNSPGGDPLDYSIEGRRYNSLGTAQGSQFAISTYSYARQVVPSVAMDSDGDFVVAWQSLAGGGNDNNGEGIQGRRFNSAGTAQGGQFQVNNYTTGRQIYAAVAVDSDGDFVIVWQSQGSNGNDSDETSIQGQRYNSAGTALGSNFEVNGYTPNAQVRPSVSLDSDGDFVVVWESLGSYDGPGSDTDNTSIQGRRYNSAGTAQGSQFQVNSITVNNQNWAVVAVDSDSDFVVAWTHEDNSIQGQRFAAGGATPTATPTSTASPTAGPTNTPPMPTSTTSPTAGPTNPPTPTPTVTPTSLPGPTGTATATQTSPTEEWVIHLPAVMSDGAP